MQKKAIILGATGLTGGYVLDHLLNSENYREVLVFGRSSVNREHPKLTEHLCDLTQLEDQASLFEGDEVYCCIGTTKAKTPDKEQYRAIDYGIPLAAANLCSRNNINTFVVISAMGANEKSAIFYNRLKGEMELAVLEQGIPYTYIVQPGLIGGEREEPRPGEWFFKQLFKGLNYLMVGPLKKYRSIHPDQIARAMICLAHSERPPGRFPNDELMELAENCKSYIS